MGKSVAGRMVKQPKSFSQINFSPAPYQTTPMLAGKLMIKKSEEITRSLITTILGN
ncbi:MAG: hypothetical protein ICV54_20445 [Nostoc sp. C3-bin3]|nr:hypothetical protein [Nostoc sp. C3-bin3]